MLSSVEPLALVRTQRRRASEKYGWRVWCVLVHQATCSPSVSPMVSPFSGGPHRQLQPRKGGTERRARAEEIGVVERRDERRREERTKANESQLESSPLSCRWTGARGSLRPELGLTSRRKS